MRLPEDLAEWLSDKAKKTGVSQGKLIRDQLERARSIEERPFLRLAGSASAIASLSARRGFSKS